VLSLVLFSFSIFFLFLFFQFYSFSFLDKHFQVYICYVVFLIIMEKHSLYYQVLF
jgi:hypothetical protein